MKECGRPAHIDPAWLQRRASRPPSFKASDKRLKMSHGPQKGVWATRPHCHPAVTAKEGESLPSPGLALVNKNSSCPLRFFLVRAARLQIHHQNTNICWIHATDTIGLTQRARHNFDQLLRALSPQSFD